MWGGRRGDGERKTEWGGRGKVIWSREMGGWGKGRHKRGVVEGVNL